MMTFTDQDLADDRINFAMTQWEHGAHPDDLAEERSYDCGCRAVKVHTAAGWQWIDAPEGGCADETHRARAAQARG